MENIENIEKKDNSETSSELSHLSVLTTSVGSEEVICNYNHFINEIKNCDNMIYQIKWDSNERKEDFIERKNKKKNN